MKKSTLMVKKLIALFLVVLISIDSLAAVVSDNDGRAFITKAEFDSLLNDFNTKLNTEMSLLDSRIDNAIASYLAGIGLKSKSTLKNLMSGLNNIGNNGHDGILWGSGSYILNGDPKQQYKLLMDIGWYEQRKSKRYYYYGTGIANRREKRRIMRRFVRDQAGKITGVGDISFPLLKEYTGLRVAPSATGTSLTDWNVGAYDDSANSVLNPYTNGSYKFDGTGNDSTANLTLHSTFFYVLNEEFTEVPALRIGIYPLSENKTEYVRDKANNPLTKNYTYGNTYLNTDTSDAVLVWGGSDIAGWTWYLPNVMSHLTCEFSGHCTAMSLASFKYANFLETSAGNAEIRSGLVIAETTATGSVTVTGSCDKDGYVILYHAPSADPLWGGQRTSTTDVTSWKISKNLVSSGTTWTRTLDNVNAKDYIYALFLPSDTSVLGKMTINEITQTSTSK